MAFTKSANRKLWFHLHKWIGLALAAAIIPICIGGTALVWHDALDDILNPQCVVQGSAALAPSSYADAARAKLAPGERLSSIEIPETGAVLASAARPPQFGGGRPVRTHLWLDPSDRELIDTAASDASIVRFLHALHGSLFVPEWGCTIVGWIGVAKFISSTSGIWLWRPAVGSWFKRLRWRRRRNFDTNLHHLFGFWIAVPLFILSATGAWISFPKLFSGFEAAEGEHSAGTAAKDNQALQRDRGATREQRMRARPIVDPVVSFERALAAASESAPGRVARVSWPTDVEPYWTIAIGPDARDRQKEVKIDSLTGKIRAKPPSREPEVLSRLMRRIHDGTDMGWTWQLLVFIGGLLPAALSITGIIMWWRARGWRSNQSATQHAKRQTASA